MLESTVEVHLTPVMALSDPLTFEIKQTANLASDGPVKAADFGETLRDAYSMLSDRLNTLRPSRNQLLTAELEGAELLHLLVGWLFGWRCPTHPFMLGKSLVGDFGLLQESRVKPLSRLRDRLPKPPAYARNRLDGHLVAVGYANASQLVKEEVPQTVTVHPRFARFSPEEIASLGWQIGLWFGDRTLLYPMGGQKRFRVADGGGLLGGVIEIAAEAEDSSSPRA